MMDGDPEDITLLDVFESIEGPLDPDACLLGTPACDGECILGGVLESVNHLLLERLSSKRLSDFADAYAD